ncbi:putative Translocon-associated protein subunit beta [Hypsibius exemplaris]|uniref:Translocon-associated protein subunit beta n=1 Tax=Hypsibius exemplaris TaxID=2072580 RepID=A0A1W0WMQ8_HYPEX|nr:putative Translocon-associated protein subunit beta [Hypsibius exemplaris]
MWNALEMKTSSKNFSLIHHLFSCRTKIISHLAGFPAVILPDLCRNIFFTMKLLLLLCLFGLSAAQESAGSNSAAHILASKTVLNQYLVQKKDLTIQYSLYNIGESAAFDVQLDEQNFQKEDFDFVSGLTRVSWDRIPAGSNVTHTLTIQPKDYRIFNFTATRIQYRTAEAGDAPVVVGWSSAPGDGQIWETNHFNRQFAPHYADWITFLIMTIPTVGIPFFLWRTSTAKYEVKKQRGSNTNQEAKKQ